MGPNAHPNLPPLDKQSHESPNNFFNNSHLPNSNPNHHQQPEMMPQKNSFGGHGQNQQGFGMQGNMMGG